MAEYCLAQLTAAVKQARGAHQAVAHAARDVGRRSARMAVAPEKTVVTEEALQHVREAHEEAALQELGEYLETARDGLDALAAEREKLDVERRRRSEGVRAEVQSTVAPRVEELQRAVEHLQASRARVLEELSSVDLERNDVKRRADELAELVTAAETSVPDARSHLRALRRLREQTRTTIDACAVLQDELSELREENGRLDRLASERTAEDPTSASAAMPAPESTRPSQRQRSREDDEAERSSDDLRASVARLRARVALVRAAASASPKRPRADRVTEEWADEIEEAKQRRTAAEQAAVRAREEAARAGQQLASLAEVVLPSEDGLSRGAGTLLRRLIQEGEAPWAGIRSEVATACGGESAADAVLAQLSGIGLVKRRPDGVVRLALPAAAATVGAA